MTAGQAACNYSGVPTGISIITATYPGDTNYNGVVSSPLMQNVGGVPSVIVVKSGSGSGTISSNPSGISCGTACNAAFASPGVITLTATPDAGSVFTGWLGACTDRQSCAPNVIDTTSVSATFAPDAITPLRFDVDANSQYDAKTDGVIISRYLLGITGAALTNGALGPNASVTDPAVLLTRLNDMRPLFDIDGNGTVDVLTDGLLLVRYLSGLRNSALFLGAKGVGATRTASQIETYIQSLLP